MQCCCCCCWSSIFGTHLYAEWLSFYANNYTTTTHTSCSNKNKKLSSNRLLVTGHIIQFKSFCFLFVKWFFGLFFGFVFCFSCILTQNQQLRMSNYFGHKRIAILDVHVPVFIIANCFNIRLISFNSLYKL